MIIMFVYWWDGLFGCCMALQKPLGVLSNMGRVFFDHHVCILVGWALWMLYGSFQALQKPLVVLSNIGVFNLSHCLFTQGFSYQTFRTVSFQWRVFIIMYTSRMGSLDVWCVTKTINSFIKRRVFLIKRFYTFHVFPLNPCQYIFDLAAMVQLCQYECYCFLLAAVVS